MPSHNLLPPGRRGRRRGRPLVEPVLARGHRLLLEPLERRGMLSATIAPVGEAIAGDFEGDPDVISAESEEVSIGLPEGVSLLICPVAHWTEGDDTDQFAPASAPEPDDPFGWDETVTNWDAPLDGGDDDATFFFRAFSPVSFSCGFPADSDVVDWGAPPDLELLIDESQESTFEPTLDVEPWIRMFSGIPDSGVEEFAGGWAEEGGDVVTFSASGDPTLDSYLEFVSQNPTWPEEHGAGGIQIQVVTASGNLPWIEFGTPGEAAAFDAWYEETLLEATTELGNETDPLLTDPLLVACDGLFRPREYCSLPLPAEFSPADGEAATSTWRGGAAASFTTAGTYRPFAPVPSASGLPYKPGMPYNWMAAFAVNLPGAGGDSAQPVAGRRRSR